MLHTEQIVKANIRTREGRRVFLLPRGDTLTPGARDWLRSEKIEILPEDQGKNREYRGINGEILKEKPENMTHIRDLTLVEKTHPRILFRGALDGLQAEILLCALAVPEERGALEALLALTREILRREVLEEPLPAWTIEGLTPAQIREYSHFPGKYWGQSHFMPELGDGEAILRLNRLRTLVRRTEIKAVAAFSDGRGGLTREDIPLALNRMSGMVYLLMIRQKKRRSGADWEGTH